MTDANLIEIFCVLDEFCNIDTRFCMQSKGDLCFR